MVTEDISPRFVELDAWPTVDAVRAMYEGQLVALAAVQPVLARIAAAADNAATALGASGRLIYVGAGTSARIGVQDGAELSPTFDWPEERLVYVVAGGLSALTSSVEGAEDDVADAVAQIEAARVGGRDVLIGLAASGATPFTVAALRRAAERGAVTIEVANNPYSALLAASLHPILIETGGEVIAGSTRMKAGTAQKVVLNLLSSAIMIRLGRVYRGLMIEMRPSNAKLRHRAREMVAQVTGCAAPVAADAILAAGGDIKQAALIALGLDADTARALLTRHRGDLRAAVADLPPG